MSEDDRSTTDFGRITISESRVDSKLPDGITLSFHLSPRPVPVQWKSMFTNLSVDERGSVMSTTMPLLHGDDIVWKVSEGDIPNAKHLVGERIARANAQFAQMLLDTAQPEALEQLATPSSEIDRLQQLLDES